MRLDNINGCYNPSFFNMLLDTDGDIIEAVNENSATFVHEFIHYIQDLILPYSIRLNLSQLRWFFNIQQYAVANGHIMRPFRKWDDSSETLRLQHEYTIGINCDEAAFIDQVDKIDTVRGTFVSRSGFDAIYSQKSRTFNIYSYSIRVNGTTTYRLGARDLLEYIAYKIEAKHYPSEDELPQLPYSSVDLLFSHYGLSHVPEDIRLCIAEACLYNDNPIRFLFLNFLESEDFKQCIESQSYDEIYRSLLAMEFTTTDGVRETICHKTARRLKQFETDLNQYYANFADIRKWIKEVNHLAESELSNRFIFSDMYKMDHEEFLEVISQIISKIGLPLLMNRKKECVSLQTQQVNTDEFIQFYILQEFLSCVLSAPPKEADCGSDQKICPIYSFCRANWNIDNCVLKFNSTNNEGCPYLKFLKTYGLENIELR